MKKGPFFICMCTIASLLIFSCTPNEKIAQRSIHLFEEAYYEKLPHNQKRQYLDSIAQAVDNHQNDSVTRYEFLKISAEYYYLNESQLSKQTAEKALKRAAEVNDSLCIAKSYYYIGDSYENSKRDSAYYFYLKAEKVYEALSDKDCTAQMKFNKAYMLFFSGNYSECEVEISKALHLLQNTTNYRLKYNCLNLMGTCLEKLEEYEEAFRYHTKALETIELFKNSTVSEHLVHSSILSSTVNLANLHDIRGEYLQSIDKLKPWITQHTKENWPIEYTVMKGNMANALMKSGSLTDVLPLLHETEKIADSLQNKTLQLYTKIHFAEYFERKKDTTQLLSYLNEAYQIAKATESNDELLKIVRKLAVYDPKKERYKNEYLALTDRITKQQRKTKNKFARIEYETAQLEDENQALSKQNFYLLFFLIGLSLLLALTFIGAYINKKNKELKHLKEQKLASDELYELLNNQQKKITEAKQNQKAEIAKELHDNIMNNMYSVRLGLDAISKSTDKSQAEKIKTYVNHIQTIEKEIRDLSHSLRTTAPFEKAQFTDLVEAFTKDNNGLTMTTFHFSCDNHELWNAISNLSKVHLYRILQEWIANVNKHAQATFCTVALKSDSKKGLILEITDNGIGLKENPTSNGIGFIHLNERIQLIQAHYQITTPPTHPGTQLTISEIA